MMMIMIKQILEKLLRLKPLTSWRPTKHIFLQYFFLYFKDKQKHAF